MQRQSDVPAPGVDSADRPSATRPAQAETPSGAAPATGRVLALQRSAGNRAVAGLLAGRGNGSAHGGGGPGGTGGGPGGAGGALKPSTFGTDVAGVVQETSSAQDLAGEAATAALAAATTPSGPPVAPEAGVADPPAAATASAAGTGAPVPVVPAATEGGLPTATTTSGLAGHERAEGDALTTAGDEVAQQAAAVQVGPLGATQPVGDLPAGGLPAAGRVADAGGAGRFPSLEPDVAQVLDQGFAGQLSTQAAAVAQQREEAVADHVQAAHQARTAHDATVTAEQAAAEGQAQQVQGQARQEVATHKAAWADQGRQAAAAGRAELRSLRTAAAGDVERQAGQANSQASEIMTAARDQAAQQGSEGGPPGPSVQRSLWGRVRSAAGGLIRSARNGLSSLAGAARSLVSGALDRVRGLFDSVRQAIGDRIGRYIQAARDLAGRVRARLAGFARTALSGIRRALSWARSTVDRITAGLRALGGRLLAGLRSALSRAAGWLADRFRGLVNGLIRAGRFVLSLAGKVRQLLRVASNKVLKGIARAVDDPDAFLAPYKAQVGRMMDAVPAKAREMYDKHVAPLFGGDETPAAAGPATAVQRQPDHDGQEQDQEGQEGQDAAVAEPSRGAIVWEYLKDRFAYLGANWLGVIGNVLLEIFVPFVSLYRHLPPMLKAVWQALQDLFAGRVSDAVDQGLKAARELMAILSTLFAQVSIAAFIAGSILGTPIVGEGAMLAVGLGLLAADVVVQGATIAKATSNLDRPGRGVDQLDEDYGNIADSILSLGITLALVLIAAVGQKLGKVLIARFPRLGNALAAIRERIKASVRRRLGLPRTPPTKAPVVDVPNAPARAPEAGEFPGRAGLTPDEQLAFDRFIQAQRAKSRNGELSPQFKAKLEAASADELRRMTGRALDPARAAEARAAEEARARAQATTGSDPLDPVMTHSRDEGGNVRTRWNDTDPPTNQGRSSTDEIAQAQAIAQQTGEHIELFGNAYRGIDGTIGQPPRPLQLKGIPQSGPAGAAEVYRSAVVARDKAIRAGFHDVEVRITAPNVTRAELAAEFARPTQPGIYHDGQGVRRIVIHCAGGEVYRPPTNIQVPPPVHIDQGPGHDDGDEGGHGAGGTGPRIPATTGP